MIDGAFKQTLRNLIGTANIPVVGHGMLAVLTRLFFLTSTRLKTGWRETKTPSPLSD